MRVKPQIIQHEFIGLEANVVKSANSDYVGISGRVIDETRNMFVIEHSCERKTVMKDQTIFHFTLPDTTIVEINGNLLVGKPEERLKRRVRRLW